MNPPRSIKGMHDALPRDAARFHAVESAARTVFARYGFGELRTPLVEEAGLFQRGIGDQTDVVEKEMYVFPDRDGTPLALRPEGTASAVRAYLQHNPAAEDPITRWFYLGPMFRHENPQKGRYRQFHQVGAELFGAAAPEADVELLAMVRQWLLALGLGQVTLQLNSIGDSVCRPSYLTRLQTFLRAHEAELCDNSRKRLETNPLRVLDCKNPRCQAVVQNAPMPVDALCDPCRAHFGEVQSLLGELGIAYVLNKRLVRGLDYYTRTTFEFVWERTAEGGSGLGTQNTVAAGGRYDGLVESLGGPATPAVGFAAGIERLVLAVGERVEPRATPDLFVVNLPGASPAPENAPKAGAERRAALKLAAEARAGGLWAEIDLRGGSVKSQMRRADRLGAKLVVVLGEDELAKGKARLKRMAPAQPGGDKPAPAEEIALSELVAEALRLVGSA